MRSRVNITCEDGFPPKDSNSRPKDTFHLLLFSSSKYFFIQVALRDLLKESMSIILSPPLELSLLINISLDFVTFSVLEKGVQNFQHRSPSVFHIKKGILRVFVGSFRGDTLDFKKIFEEIPDRRLSGKVPPS